MPRPYFTGTAYTSLTNSALSWHLCYSTNNALRLGPAASALYLTLTRSCHIRTYQEAARGGN